jgi:hypothetical protein
MELQIYKIDLSLEQEADMQVMLQQLVVVRMPLWFLIVILATSSVSDPGHLHRVPNSGSAGANISAFGQGGVNNQGTYNTFSAVTGITVSTSITATGSSATNANLPPYYALAFHYESLIIYTKCHSYHWHNDFPKSHQMPYNSLTV